MSHRLALKIRLDARSLVRRLGDVRDNRVPQWRRQAMSSVARDVLQRTILRNPVDTGRSRSAWAAALRQLGGTPPAAWQGSSPDSDALADGAKRFSLNVNNTATRSEVAITNGVDYVVFLEFGTRSISPLRMVERSLTEVRDRLGNLIPSLVSQVIGR